MPEFNEKKWKKDLEETRKEKDEWMRVSPNSPLPHEERHHFKGLEYFPPDSSCRIVTKLNVYPSPERLRMATSKGVEREFIRYGHFDFVIDGKPQRLHAYKSTPEHGHSHGLEDASLFVPFRDATSGKESYGAARYLDLEVNPSGVYELDFNLAYNPYCAYSDNYICPFPPPENWLTVAIRAGERNFPRPGH